MTQTSGNLTVKRKNNTLAGDVVRSRLFMTSSLLLLLLFYAWLASAGSGNENGTTTYYYSYLADAFLHGNFHISMRPDPELLALENPYNLSARIELEKTGVVTPIDFALYKGKFYLYWGPVPALLLAFFQVFSGQQPVGDFFLAFLFAVGILLAQSLLLLAVWDRYFRHLPKWTLYLSIFLVGLVWSFALLRHDYDHARIYEAAISSGQFFLISGLWMTFTAIDDLSVPNWRLALSGSFWAMAIGSRNLLVVPIAVIVILTIGWIVRAKFMFAQKIIKLLSLGLPLLLGGLALSWYNWARFGSITETGLSYLLAGQDIQKHHSDLFSVSYIFQNLYNYIINPIHFHVSFPFVSMLKGHKDLLPQGTQFYYAEATAGLLYLFPFALFAVIPLIAFILNLFPKHSTKNPLEGNHQLPFWLTMGLTGTFVTAFGLLLTFYWVGRRYTGDFLPALTVLSALGFWQGFQFTENKPFIKRLYAISGILLGCLSVVISILLAISTVLATF